MITQLSLGAILICVTILIMTGFILAAMHTLKRHSNWLDARSSEIAIMLTLAGSAIWLVLALTVCVWIWAGAFLFLGTFATLEEALYFSVVAFTTLGFGDVVIEGKWRLLSGLIAANGLILFSFVTAFLIEILRSISRKIGLL